MSKSLFFTILPKRTSLESGIIFYSSVQTDINFEADENDAQKQKIMAIVFFIFEYNIFKVIPILSFNFFSKCGETNVALYFKIDRKGRNKRQFWGLSCAIDLVKLLMFLTIRSARIFTNRKYGSFVRWCHHVFNICNISFFMNRLNLLVFR